MSAASHIDRADRVGARATGFGAGLIAFMVTWLLGARIIERFVDAPTSAYIAMGLAIAACVVVTLRVGHRLVAGLESLPQPSDHSEPGTPRGKPARI
jgi:predicted oxidoreductase